MRQNTCVWRFDRTINIWVCDASSCSPSLGVAGFMIPDAGRLCLISIITFTHVRIIVYICLIASIVAVHFMDKSTAPNDELDVRIHHTIFNHVTVNHRGRRHRFKVRMASSQTFPPSAGTRGLARLRPWAQLWAACGLGTGWCLCRRRASEPGETWPRLTRCVFMCY